VKTAETILLDWQKQYGTEEACAQALAEQNASLMKAQVELKTA
jgi:hypothetical protein